MNFFKLSRKIRAWILYDWANSAWATTVLAGFFPLFFKKYWSDGVDVTQSSYHLGMANSLASLIIALVSPFLGVIADQGGKKRAFLIFFTLTGSLSTACLSFVDQGQWQLAVLFFVIASLGFSGGITFNDAQINDICPPKDLNRISAMGYAMGYLGGGLLFTINVLMYLKPALFGIADGPQAIKISFFMVAVWWIVFALPVFILVKDKETNSTNSYPLLVRHSFSQILQTLRNLKSHKNIALFLLAYWFYIDGVGTIIRMAVDYGMSIGFEAGDLITALLLTQFVGFPSAILFGKLGDRLGVKKTIFLCIGVYLLVSVYGYFMSSKTDFYLLAFIIGLVQGGVQALSRSLYALLIPPTQSGEFFGFFNLLGKFAAVMGPLVMGWVGMATGNPRFSVLSVSVFFIVGGIFLTLVTDKVETGTSQEASD